jgi:CO/xanthine dehydrogenase Mo-binding subunit
MPLHAVFLGSPYAHARIAHVDTSLAGKVPGVRAVLVGADMRGKRLGRRLMDWPVLAWDRVRFVGDRVAAVAAETREAAEEAVAGIAVEYEELPAVFDPQAALAADATVLHPDAAEYLYREGTRPAVPHPNVQGYARHEHGEVDAGFARAAHVLEHEFDTARVHHGYLEPRSALAWWEGDNVHLVTTNKSPFALRAQLSTALGIPAERIVVDAGTIGGDFGGKGLSVEEFTLVELARRTVRPVRFALRYADELTTVNTRHAARIRLRTGFDADGRILAHEARVVLDGGAYAAAKPVASLIPGEALATLGGYRVPAARVEALTVYTNTVPAGHMRAPGQPQNSFAAESHLDLAARAMGLDAFELRLRNALREGELDVHGVRCGPSEVARVLERLREKGAADPARPGLGRGFALGVRHVGRGTATIALRVLGDGRVEALTAVADQGGGAHTMLQRVVATTLGVAAERVLVRRGTTAETEEDPGVGGSRVTPVHGGAAHEAALALLKRLGARPGAEFEHAAADAVRGGESVEAVGTRTAARQEGFTAYAYAVDVAVDRETGAISPRRIVLVADVGTVINPVAVRGQLAGGVAFGLGQALMEELRVEEGRVVTASLGEYKLPTIADVPPLEIELLTDAPGPGPFGAKSVGELANPGVGPAIANAVHAAAGARVMSLPLTPEKVLAATRS